jgi:hypothetical protein
VDELLEQLRPHVQPALQLDQVALAVVEADGLDVGVAIERVGEADGRVLAAENSTRALRGSAATQLSLAEDDPLLRGEAFEADRAARVQLVGRDADLRRRGRTRSRRRSGSRR